MNAPAVPGWPVAFRGSPAVAAGLVTPDQLRGPRYLRPFPDTYLATPATLPPDLALRSHAVVQDEQARTAVWLDLAYYLDQPRILAELQRALSRVR